MTWFRKIVARFARHALRWAEPATEFDEIRAKRLADRFVTELTPRHRAQVAQQIERRREVARLEREAAHLEPARPRPQRMSPPIDLGIPMGSRGPCAACGIDEDEHGHYPRGHAYAPMKGTSGG
jgi:hypothetical protein